MKTPDVVWVVPDKLGGVFSFAQDMLRFRRPDEFRYRAVRVASLRDQFTAATDPLGADEECMVEHSLPDENIYAVLARLGDAIGHGPGVLVANDWLELAFAHWRDPGKAVVAIVHGDFDYYYNLAQRHEPVIDAYVTYTKQVYTRMNDLLPHRRDVIHLMRYGVPVPAYPRAEAHGPLRLLYVGRLHRDKGVLELPEIDRCLVAAGVHAQWTVHGEGPHREEMVAAWPGAGDRVTWGRHAPIDDVRALYQRHDVFVMPSRFEALPVALLEAGASGVVPVVSDLPSGIPEVVEPGITGYRLAVGDVAAFAEAIAALDRDRHALAQLSAAVRARVSERFNVMTNVGAYQALFADVRPRRPRAEGLQLPYGSRLDIRGCRTCWSAPFAAPHGAGARRPPDVRIVLALGWYFPDSVGGTEVYVAALADRYARAGHDVVIAAPQAGLAAPREYTHNGHRVFRYPVPLQATRGEARGDVPARGAEQFHAWLLRIRPDIVHVNSLVTGLGIHEIVAARRSGARVIYTNHLPSFGFVCARGTLMRWGTEACDGVREPRACAACLLEQRGVPRGVASTIARLEPRWLAQAARRWESRLGTALALPALIEDNGRRQDELLRLVDSLVVLSDWGAEIARANGAPPERVVVNKLGISREDAPAKPSPDRVPTAAPVIVGYIGRYSLVKGLREFAETIRRIDAALPLKFVFIGPVSSAGERAVYDEIRTTLAGDRRVEFRDGIDAADVPEALAALDVLCAPSVWFENGPTIALEALAVGTPVIGTRLGAFPENVADDVEGRLIPPGDVGALVAVLTEIGETPALVDRWRRGIRPVRTMTMCANDYLALYRRLAA